MKDKEVFLRPAEPEYQPKNRRREDDWILWLMVGVLIFGMFLA